MIKLIIVAAVLLGIARQPQAMSDLCKAMPMTLGMLKRVSTTTPAFSYRNTYPSPVNAGTYTFTAADFGTADATRLVIAAISTAGSNPSAVTLGGVSATLTVESSVSNSSAEIWQAIVPTGATGDVVITATSANNCVAHIFVGYPASTTAVDTGGATGAVTSHTLTDIAKTNGGFTIICSIGQNGVTISCTQTGAETITEHYEADTETYRRAVYSHINTATTTLDDYTITYSASVGAQVAIATWGP